MEGGGWRAIGGKGRKIASPGHDGLHYWLPIFSILISNDTIQIYAKIWIRLTKPIYDGESKSQVGANSRIWCDLFRRAPALSIYFVPPVRYDLAARFVALQETLRATKDTHISWAWWRGVGAFPDRSVDGVGNGRTADGGSNSGNGDNDESANAEHSSWMSYSNKCGWKGESGQVSIYMWS